MSEVIFSFDSSCDAVRAGILMNQVDPSLRYVHSFLQKKAQVAA